MLQNVITIKTSLKPTLETLLKHGLLLERLLIASIYLTKLNYPLPYQSKISSTKQIQNPFWTNSVIILPLLVPLCPKTSHQETILRSKSKVKAA